MAYAWPNSGELGMDGGLGVADALPTLSSSVSQSQRISIDELYCVKLNALVKPYKNAQTRSSLSLGVIDVNVSTMEAFRSFIFDRASQHIEGIAILENQGFVMRPEPKSSDDFHLIVSIKHRNHFYTIESNIFLFLISK